MTIETHEMTRSPADQRSYRLSCIDAVRGLAIVIMALDHVRDFFQFGAEVDPMSDPNAPLNVFVTRWITSFCAPVFVLLAGTSAGLMAARKGKGELTLFLFTRGVWLIIVECFVISTALTFSPAGTDEHGGRVVVILQVIWAIGASMVLLSGIQLMGRRACLLVGVVILLCHNMLDDFWPETELLKIEPLWVALHSQMSHILGPFFVVFQYPLLPWFGVMLLGFGLAGVFELPTIKRNGILLRTGIILTAMFLAMRASNIYGDPNPWKYQEGGLTRTIIDFLRTEKYPPSLLFLLMTLGPASIACGGCAKNPILGTPELIRLPPRCRHA